jgi:hypothetical protein
MPRVVLEPMIPELERAKTPLDRAATVIDTRIHVFIPRYLTTGTALLSAVMNIILHYVNSLLDRFHDTAACLLFLLQNVIHTCY